ncbi:MAG: CRISPR-associated endonuclease Cas2 [Campylobacteraceae bacterium]|jgi:CRISPR-associated protein Cas2|nr:CRISPR-associated endonuclease Cas2 [Campylobacteraceae bacterium]
MELLISYDISDDKLRTKFSKYLSKFGHRLQYSLFELKNSQRVINNIQIAIESNFSKSFGQTDSVIIFQLSQSCNIIKFGYAKNIDEKIIIL